MTAFKDLVVGQRFDWVDPKSAFNSAYGPCVKLGARSYSWNGHNCRVGSIYAEVFHVEPADAPRP